MVGVVVHSFDGALLLVDRQEQRTDLSGPAAGLDGQDRAGVRRVGDFLSDGGDGRFAALVGLTALRKGQVRVVPGEAHAGGVHIARKIHGAVEVIVMELDFRLRLQSGFFVCRDIQLEVRSHIGGVQRAQHIGEDIGILGWFRVLAGSKGRNGQQCDKQAQRQECCHCFFHHVLSLHKSA